MKKSSLFYNKTNNNNPLYKVLCIIWGVLLCISVVSLINRPSIGLEKSGRINFSSSEWLNQLMQEKTELYGMDFIESAGFSIQPAGGKIVLLYASEKPVSDVRDYYKKHRDATESGRNDATALNLEMDTDAGHAKMINYYSGVCQVYEMTLYLKKDLVERYTGYLDKSIPEQAIRKALEDTKLTDGKKYGAYVRYLYDDMDDLFKKDKPIFGCAFQFDNDETEFQRELQSLKVNYPQNGYDKDQKTAYFQLENGIMSISLQDGENGCKIVSISIQESA